jgi:hypothetical protein
MPAQKPYNPWESGLKESQEEQRRKMADAEAKRQATEEEASRLSMERVEAEEAMKPKPPGPTVEEFAKEVINTPDDEAKLGLLKGRAATLFGLGFLQMAADLFTQAIRLSPKSHALYGNRSACRCGIGDYELALADAEECIRLAPSWPKGFARKGAALHGLYRLDDAILAFEGGLKIDPESAALKEGLADALKRKKAMGGQWQVVVDGSELHSVHVMPEGKTSTIERSVPQVSLALSSLCAAPANFVCCIDGEFVKLCDGESGSVVRTFNAQMKDSKATTLNGAPVGLAMDPLGTDIALYTIEDTKAASLRRLLIRDSRSEGAKRESPDKCLESVSGSRSLGIRRPAGLALVDTSRMGGGGQASTLYVCDPEGGTVLALDPKEFTERFRVGRKGNADDELDMPVSVAAHGDHLAIADAGSHRVCIFTLRGTFVRSVGGKPSRFSSGARAGQFVHPPAHVGLSEGHLFVLEAGGVRVHVIHPLSGEPLGLLFPPFNVRHERRPYPLARTNCIDVSDADAEGSAPDAAPGAAPTAATGGVRAAEGCLTGLCVSGDNLYVASSHGPARIMRLARQAEGEAQAAQGWAPGGPHGACAAARH